jgi:hypothetical protein
MTVDGGEFRFRDTFFRFVIFFVEDFLLEKGNDVCSSCRSIANSPIHNEVSILINLT